MTTAKFVTATEVLDGLWEDVLTGTPPTFYPLSASGALSRVEVGPKLITLFGGPPGAGKTALVMQLVLNALMLSEGLKAVICNIEMPPEALLERQLSRLSGVPLNAIRHRELDGLEDRINIGMTTLEQIVQRLCFVKQPFDLANICATVDAFSGTDTMEGAGPLLVLDYVQRITPPGVTGDKRGSIDLTMNYLRQFADAGTAVIAVSSVGRQKDKRGGSTYAGTSLNLASYKESGELEYGADDAYLLAPCGEGAAKLSHLKARHRKTEDIYFRFWGSVQRFDEIVETNDEESSEFEEPFADILESWESLNTDIEEA